MRIKDHTDMVRHLTDPFNIPEARRMIAENPALTRQQFSEGQLVQPGPGRQGYATSSAERKTTYYKKLLENLPDGYYNEYVENFYTVDKDTGKLRHVSGGPEGKGIPYMEKKYGDIIKETYKTRQGETQNLNRKVRDINAAIKQSISDKIESGLKASRQVRKEDLKIVGKWQPTAPKGYVMHHFMPLAGVEGESLNLASTKNTAFISEELNSKMAPYNTKLKANQKEQIKLLKEKTKGWEEKIEDLNKRSQGLYRNASRKIPGSSGYLGYSQYIKQPDGSYVSKVTGIDPNKSLAGLEGEEIFYKNITKENQLKVNKMSNIKTPTEKANFSKLAKIARGANIPCIKGVGGQCNSPEDFKKGFNEVVERAAAGDKPALTKLQKFTKAMKKIKGPLKWTGYGLLGEIGFMVPFGVADYTAGKSWKRIMGNASDWGFGPMFGQSEDEEIISHIPEALKEKATGYMKAKKLHPRLEQFKDPASGSDLLYEQEDIIRGPDDQSMYASTLQGMQLDMDNIISLFKSDQDILGTEKALQASKDRIKQLEAQTVQERRDRGFIAEEGWEKNFRRNRMGGGIMGLKK